MPQAVAARGDAVGRHLRKQGKEEIPVLVDWEVQHWIDEALEGATHASKLVGDRITQIGVQCTTRDGRRSWNKSGILSLAARTARQA
jgi:hypothetical protein